MSRKKAVIISRKPGVGNRSARAERPSDSESMPALASALELVPPQPGETTEGAVQSERENVPSLGLVGKVVYGAVYCVSYGVVFSVLVVGTLVPGRSIIGKAMTDATESAKQTFGGLGKSPEKRKTEASETSTAGGVSSVSTSEVPLVA